MGKTKPSEIPGGGEKSFSCNFDYGNTVLLPMTQATESVVHIL